MPATFKMAIYTPEGEVFHGAVESLEAPGRQGRFGVLAHHAPMIAALKGGILNGRAGRRDLCFVTGEGVLEISGENVTVLVDTAAAAKDAAQAKSLLASVAGDKLVQDPPRTEYPAGAVNPFTAR